MSFTVDCSAVDSSNPVYVKISFSFSFFCF